jgi:hypothetical protein
MIMCNFTWLCIRVGRNQGPQLHRAKVLLHVYAARLWCIYVCNLLTSSSRAGSMAERRLPIVTRIMKRSTGEGCGFESHVRYRLPLFCPALTVHFLTKKARPQGWRMGQWRGGTERGKSRRGCDASQHCHRHDSLRTWRTMHGFASLTHPVAA